MPQSALSPQLSRYQSQVFGPATAAAVGDITDAAEYQHIVLVISGLAAETISATGAVNQDAAALQFTAALRPFDLATGAVAAASAMGNGSFIFRDYGCGLMRLTKSGATDNATVRVFKKTPAVP